jgi:maltooligosyltrehalose trehalohydrolase
LTSREAGAFLQEGGRTLFRLWAPLHESIELHVVAPDERRVVMTRRDDGYHETTVEAGAGTRYLYRLPDGREFPDPASRFQPEGVHGPSAVVPDGYAWTDGEWRGIALEDYVIYELHVGTFTGNGTFESAIERLDELKELGITAIELMPVAQFPGERNWGYDGVYVYAAQNSYGGPEGLKKLVDACHARGLSVVLDVVYNHLGPEGNYIPVFGPYFTRRYRTPWGDALNFDGAHSDEVRRFFIQNALYWVTDCHIDALRLDAVHAIHDSSARPFLLELAEAVHARGTELGRPAYLIAESDLNDPKVVRPSDAGGFGLDAQWSDDFHHALHTVLTHERSGYYEDFGSLDDLAAAYRDTFVYADRYSLHRRRRHGAPATDLDYSRFLAYSQNHDQVGNRMRGDRLSTLVSFEQLKVAAAAVLLSPYIPLLFMGEEYGEEAPFLYFTSHSDQDLVEAVRNGRREEFASFAWSAEVPDPDAEETFRRSSVADRGERNGRKLRPLYQELIRLRRHPAFQSRRREDLEISTHEGELLLFRRRHQGHEAAVVLNFGERAARVPLDGGWQVLLATAHESWGGGVAGEDISAATVSPHSALVLERR